MGMTTNKEIFEYLSRFIQGDTTDHNDQKEGIMGKNDNKDVWKNKDIIIQKKGTQIVLPSNPREMTEKEAIECLKRKMEQLEEDVSIHEEVDAWPLEGAYALMRVLEEIYGWADAVPTPGFFGPRPPTMVNLEVGVNQQTQVIWGEFQVPGIEGRVGTGISKKKDRIIFCISGTVKKKHQAEIKKIADKVREFCASNSLYRGEAIKVTTVEDGNGNYALDFDYPPTFMDLSKVNEQELTFSDSLQEQIQTNIWTPVEKTEYCRKHKIPLKRGVLLEGPYGTGKTLTALVSAKKANANGWTFIYLDRASALKEVLVFARQYSPAIIFTEDIERVVTGPRSVSVDDVLNNIDGVDSKNQEVLCIFTTNHIDQINKAMLRPGRLDAVITVAPPDAKAAEKLIRVYSGNLLSEKEDIKQAANELDGQIPAVIREVVERSKLYALNDSSDGELNLTGKALQHAAKGMKAHLELMSPPKVNQVNKFEAFGNTFRDMVETAVGGSQEISSIRKITEEVRNELM